MAKVELGNSARFAQKLSEPQLSADDARKETIPHFYTLVPSSYGVILRFDDAGSRAVRIRTEWRVTETKSKSI